MHDGGHSEVDYGGREAGEEGERRRVSEKGRREREREDGGKNVICTYTI